MNKEEMLQVLLNIQKKVKETKLAEYNLEEKVATLEDVFKLKEKIMTDIKYLEEKLSNDANYVDKTPYLYDESRRFNLEDYLAARKNEEEANLESIREYEKLVDELETTMELYEQETNAQIEELNAVLSEQAEELRDSLHMTEEELQKLRDSYDENRAKRDSYRNSIPERHNNLADAKDKLEELRANHDGLIAAREEAEEMLSNFDRIQSERTDIDEDAKRIDKGRLIVYKERLKYCDNVENLITYDYEGQLAQIIEDYREDRITQEEVIAKVKDYCGYIDEKFIDENIAATLNNSEVEENLKAQEECRKAIEELEEKLSDDNNYSVSAFVVERNTRQLKKLNDKISRTQSQIDSYNDEIDYMQAEIETSDSMIETLQQEKAELQKEIRRYGAYIDPIVESEMLAKIESKDEDIAYLQLVKNDSLRSIEHDTAELSYINFKQERYKELQERMTSSLEKRNSIDSSAKRLDELELAKLKDALIALERRESLIGVSLYEEFDKLFSSVNEKTEPNKETEVNENIEEELDEIKFDEDSTEENSKLDEEENSFEEKFDVPEEDVTLDEKVTNDEQEIEDFLKTIPFVDEKEESVVETGSKDEIQTDGIQNREELEEAIKNFESLVNGKRYEVKYSNDEEKSKKLAKKARSKGFVKKFAKWLKYIALIVAVVLSLKGCPKDHADEIINSAQQNPSKYDNMTEDEIKESIEGELDKYDEAINNALKNKTNEDIAKEVIKGLWGNGQERIDRLTAAGYDADEIQKIVNSLLPSVSVENETQSEIKPEQVVPEVEVSINNVTIEQQEQILKDQGITPSVDVPPTTVVDKPVYDYDINDENSYGGFYEDDQTQKPEIEAPSVDEGFGDFVEEEVVQPETPDQDDPVVEDTNEDINWGDFTEEEEIEPEIPEDSNDFVEEEQPSLNDDTITIKINNGETFNVNLGDNEYELNNSSRPAEEDNSSFVELDDTMNLTEDETGSVTLEIGGESAKAMERETELSLEDIKRIREEIAAMYNDTPFTQEEIDELNHEYSKANNK